MIYITQCKCPHDHCILALAWESEHDSSNAAEQEGWQRTLANGVDKAIKAQLLNPWCGLCNSFELTYTSHATAWKTLEEAAPHLYESEREQLMAGAILGPIYYAKRKASN